MIEVFFSKKAIKSVKRGDFLSLFLYKGCLNETSFTSYWCIFDEKYYKIG